MKQSLQEIKVIDILPNKSQPRENFDDEKVNELAESILSNGLINPIIVRKDKGKYIIVAGERRWKAHKVAKIKEINAFVKQYDNDGQWMIESLVENVQREDLHPIEKGKYLLEIKKMQNIKNNNALSKITHCSRKSVINWIDSYELSKVLPVTLNISHKIVRSTTGIENKEREKIIEFANKKKLSGTHMEEDFMPTYKKSTPDVKEALLDDKITSKQAERITKLETKGERTEAIRQHLEIAKHEKSVESSVEMQQKSFNNNRDRNAVKVEQARNWIASFKGSTVNTMDEIEKTLKLLMISLKFIPVMTIDERKKLNSSLNLFIAILEKGLQLSEQVKEKIE